MSAGGPILNGQPADDDILVQTAVGLADTPRGQKVAIMITVLAGKDDALTIADGIRQVAAQLSSTRLVVAAPGTNGITDAVAQQP